MKHEEQQLQTDKRRTNKQYEYSAKIVFYSMLIGVVLILISAIVG
jgi:hypothetical protein